MLNSYIYIYTIWFSSSCVPLFLRRRGTSLVPVSLSLARSLSRSSLSLLSVLCVCLCVSLSLSLCLCCCVQQHIYLSVLLCCSVFCSLLCAVVLCFVVLLLCLRCAGLINCSKKKKFCGQDHRWKSTADILM
jgi:hypothetical protein